MFLFKFYKELFSRIRPNDPTSKCVFDHYFFDHSYYLQKNASTEDFASLLNISTKKLGEITQYYYAVSFQLLINQHRYQHFVQELESPINSNLSIQSIIKLCGYENNDKFVEYVKKQNKKA